MRNQDFIIATNKVNDASLSAFLIKKLKSALKICRFKIIFVYLPQQK